MKGDLSWEHLCKNNMFYGTELDSEIVSSSNTFRLVILFTSSCDIFRTVLNAFLLISLSDSKNIKAEKQYLSYLFKYKIKIFLTVHFYCQMIFLCGIIGGIILTIDHNLSCRFNRI